MEFIGFSEEATKWVKFYLSNRKFKVHIKNTSSDPGKILCRVPQGFILEPLLFLLYTMLLQCVGCELLLYANRLVYLQLDLNPQPLSS